MAIQDYNILLDSEFTYQQYAAPVTLPSSITNISGDVTIINTINGGGGGQATGPTITISGGNTGLNFIASGSTIALEGTLDVDNGGTGATTAAAARGNLGAAQSGANADINSFSALTGNTGVNPWTGTPNGGSQSTYPATVASALYSQAEMQGLMDKMQDVTEFMMFLVAALLAPGIVET